VNLLIHELGRSKQDRCWTAPPPDEVASGFSRPRLWPGEDDGPTPYGRNLWKPDGLLPSEVAAKARSVFDTPPSCRLASHLPRKTELRRSRWELVEDLMTIEVPADTVSVHRLCAAKKMKAHKRRFSSRKKFIGKVGHPKWGQSRFSLGRE